MLLEKIKSLFPKKCPEDQLYNRRLMSYLGLAFSVFWFQEVLILVALGYIFKIHLDAAVVVALLGVPATLAGLGFWRYLEACKLDDGAQTKKDPKYEAEGS